jgi:hypothetical protein
LKVAVEAMKNKEMGSCKAYRVFNLPPTTLQPYVKDQQKNLREAVKTKLGRKQVLPCEAENDRLSCLLMGRKFLD